jgi:hypothetical protein
MTNKQPQSSQDISELMIKIQIAELITECKKWRELWTEDSGVPLSLLVTLEKCEEALLHYSYVRNATDSAISLDSEAEKNSDLTPEKKLNGIQPVYNKSTDIPIGELVEVYDTETPTANTQLSDQAKNSLKELDEDLELQTIKERDDAEDALSEIAALFDKDLTNKYNYDDLYNDIAALLSKEQAYQSHPNYDERYIQGQKDASRLELSLLQRISEQCVFETPLLQELKRELNGAIAGLISEEKDHIGDSNKMVEQQKHYSPCLFCKEPALITSEKRCDGYKMVYMNCENPKCSAYNKGVTYVQ